MTRDEHSVDAVMLRLPARVRACLFDLDGVLTDTAELHAAAWKEMFDAFLRSCSKERSEPFAPFDPDRDYHEYVDGRARADGVSMHALRPHTRVRVRVRGRRGG